VSDQWELNSGALEIEQHSSFHISEVLQISEMHQGIRGRACLLRSSAGRDTPSPEG